MSRRRLFRLGLFQLAAGSTSVIFLGVVNRVMRVELGLDLLLVSLLVGGGHYLGALAAIPFGHYSDTHRLAGYRRTAYALGGALVTAALLAAAPYVVTWLAAEPTPARLLLGFGFFSLEGLATYLAGTAFLALLADLTSEAERGPATGLAWTLLMVGIIATGIGTGRIMGAYSFEAFVTLAVAGAAVLAVFSAVALAGQERRQSQPQGRAAEPKPPLRQSLQLLTRNHSARWFAAFLLLALFSYFMQDVILEPFGGEVFGQSAAQTARFNAYMGTGVILGMLLGGLRLIPRYGKPRITAVGVGLQVVAFALLAWASAAEQVAWVAPGILGLGLGAGLFTVGGVALMMDMTAAEHTGLFVGAWTLIQATAKGPASIAGGALVQALMNAGLTAGQAYGGAFALEGLGLLVSLYCLARVGVQSFRREAAEFGTLVAQAGD